jgi:predicted MFS family arabinose efflux permease
MAVTARRLGPTPGSWISIGLIYCYGVLVSASLSKVIPLLGDLGLHLGATPGQAALVISLLAVLPAIMASLGGSIVDRLGAHRALQLVAVTGVALNGAYLLADSLHAFMAIRVGEGLLAVGAYSAAPGLIMATTAPERRSRAMAVWSTYTPVGISLGLVLGGLYAGQADWRGGYLVHMILFAVLAATCWLLPRAQAIDPAHARRPPGVFAAWTQAGPLRLALTFAALVLIGLGMSSVYPQWYADQHGVSVGRASTVLAFTNAVMIPAGFVTGALLARGWRDDRLFTGLCLATVVLALPLFTPGLAGVVRLPTMVVWMLVQGAMIAVVTSALPRVVADPRQGSAAAGLLSQLAAMVTFVTPLVWQPLLHRGMWPGFVAVAAAAAVAALLLFPRRAASRAG